DRCRGLRQPDGHRGVFGPVSGASCRSGGTAYACGSWLQHSAQQAECQEAFEELAEELQRTRLPRGHRKAPADRRRFAPSVPRPGLLSASRARSAGLPGARTTLALLWPARLTAGCPADDRPLRMLFGGRGGGAIDGLRQHEAGHVPQRRRALPHPGHGAEVRHLTPTAFHPFRWLRGGVRSSELGSVFALERSGSVSWGLKDPKRPRILKTFWSKAM
ncbi:unnamed protein product, partial [Durusdinium trenchii]